MKLISIFLLTALSFTSFFNPVFAQSDEVTTLVLQGKIVEIESTLDPENQSINIRTYVIEVVEKGERKTFESIDRNPIDQQENIFNVGDRVVVEKLTIGDVNEIYQITDFVRTTPIIVLFVIFAALTIVVARRKGILSLVGLFISFFIIFYLVLPQMLRGADPLIITIAASILIIPINFYLAHGLNRKTTYAVISTFVTLIITSILSLIFVQWARLSGFTSDEAGFLNALTDGAINIRDLLLAGILIGVLGILDDITVSQSSITRQLKATNPKIKFD